MFRIIMLFVFGLLLLIKGGDWFVDGATGVAHKFRIPEIIIGATVVSIGTTLPEVMVSAQSAALGQGDMAYGNAIGSIICNTSLIAAITIAIRPPEIDRKTFILPVIFFFIAATIYVVTAYVFEFFSLTVGIILIAIFLVYMVFTVLSAIKAGKRNKEMISKDAIEVQEEGSESPSQLAVIRDAVLIAGTLAYFIVSFFHSLAAAIIATVTLGAYIVLTVIDKVLEKKRPSENASEEKSDKLAVIKQIVLLVIGAAVIALGARLLVDNGTLMAQKMGVPETVIGLTFVALGTSLPELVTAITSLIKKHGSLSLGNIIGANLFNLVLVSGIAITIAPFAVPVGNMIGSFPASFVIDLPVMLLVMLLLTLPAVIRGKLSRWQGITLLCIYAAFCVVQFVV